MSSVTRPEVKMDEASVTRISFGAHPFNFPEGEVAMQTDVKQRVVREANELLWTFLFLALFFCTLATYSMLLLGEYHVRYITYGSSLLQAAVLAKSGCRRKEGGTWQEARAQTHSCFRVIQSGTLRHTCGCHSCPRRGGESEATWSSVVISWASAGSNTRAEYGRFLGLHSLLHVLGAATSLRRGQV